MLNKVTKELFSPIGKSIKQLPATQPFLAMKYYRSSTDKFNYVVPDISLYLVP